MKMAPQTETAVYATKTQLYLKVKKPLLERQRRARINKCLDSLKMIVADFQADDAILRMDKAEMLESAVVFIRKHLSSGASVKPFPATTLPMDTFRNGYMNAVSEVSRCMAATPDMSVEVGKAVMTQLGVEFQRLISYDADGAARQTNGRLDNKKSPLSPASSGYHSDCEDIEVPAPVDVSQRSVWRPW